MTLLFEDRAIQAIRHLQPKDRSRVLKALDLFQESGVEGIRQRGKSFRLAGSGTLFVLSFDQLAKDLRFRLRRYPEAALVDRS